MNSARLKFRLTIASLKVFLRQREALIWTILLPVFMIVLFGLVDFGGIGTVKVGLVAADSDFISRLLKELSSVDAVELSRGAREQELDLLLKGERDLVMIVGDTGGEPDSGMVAYVNDASPEESQLSVLIVQSALDNMAFRGHPDQTRSVIRTTRLPGRTATYIDFLVPGVVAMSIMQMGIFGVAFSFVSLKKRGVLRRLSVTPLRPNDFITAQIVMRLVIVLAQISILIGVGMLFLGVHFAGNLFDMFVLGVLGAFVFLAIGFAIAGASKSEDQVAPLSNVIAMPMILLSGVFFSRSGLPDVVHTITGFLPLTYLADGMRSVAIEGAGLIDVWPQIAGLLVWSVIAAVCATRFFRWE